MNPHKLATAAAILSVSVPVAAIGQDDGGSADDLDLTIRLMPEGAEESSEITRTITLPDSVPERVSRTVPGENAGNGESSSESSGRPDDTGGASLPDDVDAPGLDVAEDAISGEGGREFGQDMRDRMNEAREDVGRSGRAREDLPVPEDTPGPGDVPMPDNPSAGAGGGPTDDLPTPDTPATPDTPNGPPGD